MCVKDVYSQESKIGLLTTHVNCGSVMSISIKMINGDEAYFYFSRQAARKFVDSFVAELEQLEKTWNKRANEVSMVELISEELSKREDKENK